MNMDRTELEQLRHADEMRIEAERLKREFEDAVRGALERYHYDPEFHARVYQVARVIDMDPGFIEVNAIAGKHADDLGPQWELALGLALRSVVAASEMRPGGILNFAQVSR